MGIKGVPLTVLFLVLLWRVTLGQYWRGHGFQPHYGYSEAPCGPSARFQQRLPPQPQRPPLSGGFPPYLTPYQAALMDIDYPPGMFGGFANRFPPQGGQNYYRPPPQRTYSRPALGARNPSRYRPEPAPRYPSRRRVKRFAMFGARMNCQCDSAADCNRMATWRGHSYNSECSTRHRLVCCCRGA